MQNYIKNIKYINTELHINDIEEIQVPKYNRLILEPEHPSYKDSLEIFNQVKYKYPYLPLYLGDYIIPNIENLEFNCLRLLIRENSENNNIFLPKQLIILKDFLLDNINYHRQHYSINKDAFIYLTVRTSSYEDLYYKNSCLWHIDGFQGSRISRHIIEQDIIWSNKNPTEFSIQPYFCENLNPSKHDINDFFDKNTKNEFIVKSKSNSIYLITPYNIHRVSPNKFEGNRVFIRLNFSPVIIEDTTNTFNPAFDYKFPFRRDVRDFLRSYNIDEFKDSGFYF